MRGPWLEKRIKTSFSHSVVDSASKTGYIVAGIYCKIGMAFLSLGLKAWKFGFNTKKLYSSMFQAVSTKDV